MEVFLSVSVCANIFQAILFWLVIMGYAAEKKKWEKKDEQE